ncbi:MAG TPA: TIGR00296 family protein [Candidatus Nitrosopolaris sp.]|nr:TIGR00296 family protein [Candidatus Nitrosopolaris sp.]
MMILDEDGEKAVRLARTVVETHLNSLISSGAAYGDADYDNDGNCRLGRNIEGCGVFVTLNYLDSLRQEHLRGCIGFPIAEKSLYRSIIEASIAAATQDPRFSPVDKKELPDIVFEVSILTRPEEIKVQNPMDYLNVVKVGRDGLVLTWRYGSGLLLPQVPVELKWDTEEFLVNLCYKAGAPPDIWLMPDSKLFSFQASIYKESYPNGEIVRVKL